VRAPAWPLASELGLARDLFALHLLRDPNLFTLEWEVPDPIPPVPVLPMILLPLAENAVKHGPGAGHRGVLRFLVRAHGTKLRITIENPGAYAGPRAGSEGLPTVERRLHLAYGGDASIGVAGEGDRTRVQLDLPCQGPERGVNV
jgi:LytS/YehU family sensor histidine kinase